MLPDQGFPPLRCGITKGLSKNMARIVFIQPHYALLYVVKGSGFYEDCETGESYPFEPGMLMQRFPNRKHILKFKEPVDFILTFVALPCQDMLSSLNLINHERPVLPYGISNDVVLEYMALTKELSEQNEFNLPQTSAKMFHFMARLLTKSRSLGVSHQSEELLDQACRFLREKPSQRLVLSEVAEKLNISYSKFRKLFKQVMGISPGDYRIAHRIEIAAELLSETEQPVEMISSHLGYPDIYTFSKQFKQVTGQSPRQFRQKK